VCFLHPPGGLGGSISAFGSEPLPRYRQLEHTSDVKVAIYGRDLAELFANAAFCLFDLMLDLPRVEAKQQKTIELESADLPELFLDWLRELLFLFSTHGFAVSRAEVRIQSLGPSVPGSLGPCSLSAVLLGEPYVLERHGLKVEVKTPTYHEYKLESSADGYKATLVLDV